ncbi:sedoheptulose-1,7-bisphosphatase [Coniochaeta ligniaria NRRL 30616]|uniref:Sedoheptulose-1,7-bisphosphatase n=1 Tax=Coniochaeta ligniaria NRRL 30616 TaxID=1408157 RepID=A0A1J7ICY9_9PEZI|nr:sedoheptulose-1,7-bisphosphatase [Coniochaeta ligniaria NRRL 30616]
MSPPGTGLVDHLRSLLPLPDHTELRESVIPTLIESIAGIAKVLQESHQVSQVGTANAFGDDQLNVDVFSEKLIRSAIANCPSVVAASSEEDPVERATEPRKTTSSGERYAIAFDPLDGSSIIAPNWTVGTIIGIWEGTTALGQAPASKQIAAILGVYGPRTTAIVALRVPGSTPTIFEVALSADVPLIVFTVRSEVKLAPPPYATRYFAPANLRAAADDERYMGLITHYIKEKYTLRYSGGLVPDVIHMLVKGHGVYVSPVVGGKGAKLRRLYELCPIALIIECAGGRAVDPVDGTDILSRAVENEDERGGLLCGNADEVEFVIKSLVG